jgi:hypothetical protein
MWCNRYLQALLLKASDYPFGISKPSFSRLLITPLVSPNLRSQGFWLPLWHLQALLLKASDYPFGIFKPCFSRLLITPLVSSNLASQGFWLPFWYLQTLLLKASDYRFGIWKTLLLKITHDHSGFKIACKNIIICKPNILHIMKKHVERYW